jgi:serine/threonine protein kinase
MSRYLGGERYELNERLGHGGMATVFSARDLKLDREVAIKLLADNLAGDDEVRGRFSREARLAAKLDHPNIVQVFDVGEDDGRPFIVMERIDGGTLDDRLNGRKRSIPTNEGLRLLCTPTRRSSSTVTSSRRTCFSAPRTAVSRSPTSASPVPPRRPPA